MSKNSYTATILIFYLIFISCTTDNTEANTSSNYKLTKIDVFDADNNLTGSSNFTYDDHFRLISITNETDNVLNYTYNNNNNNITSIINNGTVINYEYDGNLIVLSTREINGELSPNVLEFEYDSMDRLVNTKIYVNNALSCEIMNSFDSDNNIETATTVCDGLAPTQKSFEYDAMKNPATLYYNSALITVLNGGNHNITTTYNNDTNAVSSTSYEYNDEGYPTVAITTNTEYNTDIGPSVIKYEYTY